MIVSKYKYAIKILALYEDGNYLIEVSSEGKEKHVTVGPRDCLSTTIKRIQRGMENGRDS